MRNLLFVIGAMAAILPSFAQQPRAVPGVVKVAQAADSRCRKDVKDYIETLRFVRENAGPQISDRIAAGYVTESELDRVVNSQGPCAAAQLLRERRANR